jgi:hypothetical protein
MRDEHRHRTTPLVGHPAYLLDCGIFAVGELANCENLIFSVAPFSGTPDSGPALRDVSNVITVEVIETRRRV